MAKNKEEEQKFDTTTGEPISDSGASDYVFDPAASVSSEETSSGSEYTQPKRRGRKPGTGKKTTKEAHSNLTNIIMQSHVMLAALLDVEELMLNQQEASNLADAVERVEVFYERSPLGDEATAWLNLAIVCAITYGPRFMAHRKRTRKQKPIVMKRDETGGFSAEAVQ